LLTTISHPQLTPQELEDIVAAFKDTTEPKAVWASGIHIAGEKYMTIKAEDKSLYGMKVRYKQTPSEKSKTELTYFNL